MDHNKTALSPWDQLDAAQKAHEDASMAQLEAGHSQASKQARLRAYEHSKDSSLLVMDYEFES